jgi:hypothetical protein
MSKEKHKITLTQTEVSQTIDLSKLFGESISKAKFKPIREAFGQAVIDLMKERTERGVDIKGKPFKAYSPQYVKSLDFAAAGKSKNKINMTLSGDMLGLLDVVENKKSEIKIGWGSDETENAKAYNHNEGDTLPKRAFFGVTEKELQKLAETFKDDVEKIVDKSLEKNIDLDAIKALGRKDAKYFLAEVINGDDDN